MFFIMGIELSSYRLWCIVGMAGGGDEIKSDHPPLAPSTNETSNLNCLPRLYHLLARHTSTHQVRQYPKI